MHINKYLYSISDFLNGNFKMALSTQTAKWRKVFLNLLNSERIKQTEFNSGVYLLKVQSKQGNYTTKIKKQ